MNRTVWIGIDPGTNKNVGIATWTPSAPNGFRLVLQTANRQRAVAVVRAFLEDGFDVRVVIEDPRQNKPVFHKNGVGGAAALSKVAQNIGMVKFATTVLVEDLTALGVTPILERPKARKWTPGVLATITGYHARSSQHARDAARLVVGRG